MALHWPPFGCTVLAIATNSIATTPSVINFNMFLSPTHVSALAAASGLHYTTLPEERSLRVNSVTYCSELMSQRKWSIHLQRPASYVTDAITQSMKYKNWRTGRHRHQRRYDSEVIGVS